MCAIDVLELSTVLKFATIGEVQNANKTLKKLSLEKCTLWFSELGDLKGMKLVIFSDASHANLPDSYSNTTRFIKI